MKNQKAYFKLTTNIEFKNMVAEMAAVYGIKPNELAMLILESYFDNRKKEILEMYKKLASI